MAVSTQINNSSPPDIFKLNVDCMDEIFEYLTQYDLRSIAQTCKALQKVAGEYYQRNYQASKSSFGMINLQYFRPYIQYVVCDSFCFYSYVYDSSLDLLDSIIGDFTSAKQIYLSGVNFDILKSENMRKILSNIEALQLNGWRRGHPKFYELLLEICKNLKRFSLSTNFKTMDKKWLQRNYPKLEHIELMPDDDFKTTEIITFLEINPKIQSFCTDARWLWENRTKLLQMNVNLEELKIKLLDHGIGREPDLKWREFFEFLNQLYDRGFYKKFHFYYDFPLKKSLSQQLPSVKGLEKLTIFECECECELYQMNNLKELAITNCYPMDLNLDDLPNKLVNLERILLRWVSYENILPFIRRSRYLTKIKLRAKDEDLKCFNGGIVNLIKLNDERAKLDGARKLTIFVDNGIFLATKWTTPNGNTDLEFIELRPTTSYRWDDDYYRAA